MSKPANEAASDAWSASITASKIEALRQHGADIVIKNLSEVKVEAY